jgi:antitoxin component of RelBE/YafQ-DinJ toxin-antitoxin module
MNADEINFTLADKVKLQAVATMLDLTVTDAIRLLVVQGCDRMLNAAHTATPLDDVVIWGDKKKDVTHA